MIGRRDFFCSSPLCFFPCPRLSSYLLRLSLCLISFLLFPCEVFWKTLVHEFRLSYSHTEWYFPFFARRKLGLKLRLSISNQTKLTIEETNNIKFIRIIFDKHLAFKNHVDVIARKLYKSVGILFKLSKYLPLEIIKTLYCSRINKFLPYGIEVWHDAYANITNKMFILRKNPAGPSMICLSILTRPNT